MIISFFRFLSLFSACAAAAGSVPFRSLWKRAIRHATWEQMVEDSNVVSKMNDHLERRLIALPLTDEFNPSRYSPLHGKIQHGDKCSLPLSIGATIISRPYEVPWLFEVTRGLSARPIDIVDEDEEDINKPAVTSSDSQRLDRVYCRYCQICSWCVSVSLLNVLIQPFRLSRPRELYLYATVDVRCIKACSGRYCKC
jgi:hypothetical protein